jgi:uncharacterized membrane protein
MIKISQGILFTTALTTGLVAGLFYSWSVSVTPGLHKLSDKEYIMAFQAMNKAILNPAFFFSFIGSLILLPLATWTNSAEGSVKFYLLLAATICYVVGVFGVTVAGNVPMNDSLAAFDSSTASVADIAAKRLSFENPWNSLNTIRTLGSVVTLILVILSCMRGSSK